MNRRKFLACLAAAGACLYIDPVNAAAEDSAPHLKKPTGDILSPEEARYVKEAMFYQKKDDNVVLCQLCPRECEVGPDDRGYCGVRENRNGIYNTLVHSRAVALNNDPIEKKPFNHFRPGTMVLSVAAAGCNINCKFCQNWQISQFRPEEIRAHYLPPKAMVQLAREKNIPNIAFTYAEPTIFYEYMYDTSRLASENGLNCVVVSNGFINPEPVKKLVPHLAAYKIDLKAFTEDYYQNMCSAQLKPVLNTLETLKKQDIWVEIVNLVLPTANDDENDVLKMAQWIKTNLGDDIPLHFTRFYPQYKIKNLPPTPVPTLEKLHAVAKSAGLKYVYLGNVPGHPLCSTYCHNCNKLLIERVGLFAVESQIKDGKCPYCQTVIPGVWG